MAMRLKKDEIKKVSHFDLGDFILGSLEFRSSVSAFIYFFYFHMKDVPFTLILGALVLVG
jgi:hypothetical protein